MLSISEFRNLVDGVQDNVLSNDDLPALYAFFDLQPSPSYSLHAISEEIYRRIGACFNTEHHSISRHCKQLENELILEHVLNDEPLDPYFAVVERIRDAMRKPSEISGTMSDDWNTAINMAYNHVILQSWGAAHDRLCQIYQRQFQVAKAARSLRQRGFQLSVGAGGPNLEPESEEKLVGRLEMLIKAIGGIRVAEIIFGLIKPLYDPNQERYHLVRRVNTTGAQVNPNPPFGYILLLAAKHPLVSDRKLDIYPLWCELINLSTEYAALFNVQPYTPFELMFQDSATILTFLQDIALYDTLFGMKQIRPSDAIKIAHGVLDWLDPHQKYEDAWSIFEVLTIGEEMFEIGKSQTPVVINAKILVEKCNGISQEQISIILENVLSHPVTGSNQSFAKPTDSPGPDFFMRPLLSTGHGNYCLLDASTCSSAVVEALFYPLRKAHERFDDNVGHAIERFLLRELEGKGVTAYGGKYKIDGQDGECDLIIETSETVIFLEVKKKPLTRKASAGSTFNVLLDLAESLLEAQLQAGWHEVKLRRLGYIDLVDEKSQRMHLSLNGREVERIAVTLFDYGGFQDRMLLKQFFDTSLGLEYLSTDIPTQKKINNLNKKIEDLRAQVEQLLVLNPTRNRQIFFHCWFLSVPQMLVLLDSVTNNESFKTALWNTRHMYGGSLDFYFEHAMCKKLKGS